jgi:hypothetical protein
MFKRPSRIIVLSLLFIFSSVAEFTPSQSITIVQLLSFSSKYSDNTTSTPEIEYQDSFYIESIDKILFEESKLRFTNVKQSPDKILLNDSAINNNKTLLLDTLSKIAAEICSRNKTELILIPISFLVVNEIFHQKTWRNSKFGSNYARPISSTSNAELTIFILDKNGKILKEKTGKGVAKKAAFYSLLKKKQLEKNVVKNASKKFAPPNLRSINKAIKDALMF